MSRIVKKAEDRREEILGTAKHLFQNKGFDNTSMQDLMQALGVAKGTIYHYFKSKEELLQAVIEHMLDESCKRMQKLVEGEGTAQEKFQALIEQGRLEEPGLLDALHSPGNESMHLKLLAHAIGRQAPIYAAVIEQGVREGVYKTEHPLECAEVLLSSYQFLTDLGIHPWTKGEIERRRDAFPTIIQKLLGQPSF